MLVLEQDVHDIAGLFPYYETMSGMPKGAELCFNAS